MAAKPEISPEPADGTAAPAAPARVFGIVLRQPKLRETVEEGLYIASAATKLSLKNRILMETLVSGGDYDVDRFVPDARDTLLALADEAEQGAERIKRERKDAWRRHSDPNDTHDYGSRDVGNLRRRIRQSQHVAKALRARAADDDALRLLVEAAREAAWGEIAANIDRMLRVEAARPDLEPNYDVMRGARMDALRMVDLSRLGAQQKRRTKLADEAKLAAEEKLKADLAAEAPPATGGGKAAGAGKSGAGAGTGKSAAGKSAGGKSAAGKKDKGKAR